MNALIIASSTIRQDADGRYSLNDLHRAAGGEQRHQPRYWLANQQTTALIAELGDSVNPLSVTKGGSEQGTYVVKELVYAYAMWISAAFHLQVIRAYDALVTQQDPMAMLRDPAALRGLLAGYAERTQALEHQVAEQAPKVQALGRIADARGALCLTDAAKALQMRPSDLIAWMQQHTWIHKRAGTSWLAYQPRIASGMLVHKVVTRGDGSEQRLYDQVLVTPKGLARLAELLQRAEVH
jgi:phage antirepressor YoqD-like protein